MIHNFHITDLVLDLHKWLMHSIFQQYISKWWYYIFLLSIPPREYWILYSFFDQLTSTTHIGPGASTTLLTTRSLYLIICIALSCHIPRNRGRLQKGTMVFTSPSWKSNGPKTTILDWQRKWIINHTWHQRRVLKSGMTPCMGCWLLGL
jgi:hypothetical protein